MRIFGDSDRVKNDVHWRTVLIGGEFGEHTYEPIYNDLVHSYFNIPYDMPYSVVDSLRLYGTGSQQITMQISYDYLNHLQRYEDHVSLLDSELLMPNIDMIYEVVTNEHNFAIAQDRLTYDEEYINFMTCEGAYNACSNLLAYNPDKLPAVPFNLASIMKIRTDYPEIYRNNSNLSIEYLTASYIQNPLSASTQAWVESKFKNVLYDHAAMDLRNESDYAKLVSKAPYMMRINIPHYEGNLLDETSGYFIESINNNGFDSRFVKALYETFGNSTTDNALEPRIKEYITYSDYLSGSVDSFGSLTHNNEVKTAVNTSYREVDYMNMLAYCYNHYISSAEENVFVGAKDLKRISADDTTGVYRHVNTEAAIGAISDAVEFMSGTHMPFEERNDLFGENTSYSEVLAYRVEKIGGPPVGDSFTQDSLQNFWMIKDPTTTEFVFNDTQVKYGEEYTYKIYAYVIAGGYRYRYSDLAVSRDLGCTGSSGEYGLEMYDPYNAGYPAVAAIWSGSSDLSAFNEDAAEPQVLSDYKYVADVNLNYEACLKILEVPIITKTLKVQDNPPNNMNISPYQLIDNSQRIGFNLSFGVHLSQPFPNSISEKDDIYKDSYMHARDYIEDSDVMFETVSEPRYIEVYRLPYRPTSLRDFANALIKTIDLSVENDSKYSFNSTHFDDTVRVNQKYYYMFRTLNQHGNIGYLSEIYESQLINDGGYLYAIFNVLYHYEIEEEVFIQPTKSFKKIFQLQPNMNQIEMNTDDVDYSAGAVEQIGNVTFGNAEESIWDKQFKIRLTSKKTGRKIDLNITYNLNSD